MIRQFESHGVSQSASYSQGEDSQSPLHSRTRKREETDFNNKFETSLETVRSEVLDREPSWNDKRCHAGQHK